jgi:hypothetical protein
MSAISPISPVEQRDIRSAAKEFKRARDTSAKWSNGTRPSAGVTITTWASASPGMCSVEEPEVIMGGSAGQREKVRPVKQWSQM